VTSEHTSSAVADSLAYVDKDSAVSDAFEDTNDLSHSQFVAASNTITPSEQFQSSSYHDLTETIDKSTTLGITEAFSGSGAFPDWRSSSSWQSFLQSQTPYSIHLATHTFSGGESRVSLRESVPISIPPRSRGIRTEIQIVSSSQSSGVISTFVHRSTLIPSSSSDFPRNPEGQGTAPTTTGSTGLILGIVFGLLALIALAIAALTWWIFGEQSSEELYEEETFQSETEVTEETFGQELFTISEENVMYVGNDDQSFGIADVFRENSEEFAALF
jgi:hypothetical protein